MYGLIKRGFDILVSLVALALLCPVFLIVALGIKLSSPGPVLYRSERIGQDRKPFNMLKFRTMHLMKEGAEESEFLVNEDRIFPFGHFLRRSKLDETPQMLNVLLSQMSLVGPRPYPPDITERDYTGEYAVVLTVKPGLACYDSLFDYAHGELFVTDDDEYEAKILPVRTELARMYVERRGIGTDLGIIGRTFSLIWQITVLRRETFAWSKTELEAKARVERKKEEQGNAV